MAADPEWLIGQVAESQDGLDAAVAGLEEPVLREPSYLPGWSRGHVLAHLVGNATAMAEMFEGYAAGREVRQYGGSEQRRAAEIEAWQALAGAELIALVGASGARCLAAYRALLDWDGTLQWLSGRWPARRGPISRWREIEIHRVDLALGYTCADWSRAFVDLHLATELPRLAERAPGLTAPTVPPAEQLAWLVGRGAPGLPELPSWG